jgi:hypothetical protein
MNCPLGPSSALPWAPEADGDECLDLASRRWVAAGSPANPPPPALAGRLPELSRKR